jgi:hypothetical protein
MANFPWYDVQALMNTVLFSGGRQHLHAEADTEKWLTAFYHQSAERFDPPFSALPPHPLAI